ncbi:MAG: FtsH protease activity modulator HflK [Proteobacteria bacterium]|nr:FtsH protease activity modulator HflK [Pseudomonadota bacterium]MBU1610606.1 FtsH protease activity modulator HflK [Pseudomonadota bacterium]
MNWDWDKLQQQRQRRDGPLGGGPPKFDDLTDKFKRFGNMKLPGFKIGALVVLGLWLLSGVFMVDAPERGVVKLFGEFNREVGSGIHYHAPFPIESAETPNVDQVQRIEIGFRSSGGERNFQQGQSRSVPDESLMLTGDENIVDVQFSVQYRIKSARDYLFNVDQPDLTVIAAAEAAMREVVGKNKIDDALTDDKERIMHETEVLMQSILDSYGSGIDIDAVQMQNVHPPDAVSDAFKDVTSAKEDKARLKNEAEAYEQDILPKSRGLAEAMVRSAEAYKESKILAAQGDASRFSAVLHEYNKAKDVTSKRLYLETMERILSNPETEKLILSDDALKKSIPYLPLNRLERPVPEQPKQQ